MKPKKGHVYFSAFLLLISGYAILAASRWSFKTGFFPLAIAIPLFVLILIHLYLEFFGAPETAGGPAVDTEFSGEVSEDIARRRALAIFAWIAAFILFVYLIGFPLTVPLFVFSYLKFQSDASSVHAVVLTAITWGFFYLLFQKLVHIQFEAGLIQALLGM